MRTINIVGVKSVVIMFLTHFSAFEDTDKTYAPFGVRDMARPIKDNKDN